jgi:DNA-binding transcriptional MerR regulator
MSKSPDAFRTISEVSATLEVPQHVLRFWETKFAHVKPLKRGGGRRYYRPADVEVIRGIQTLLYTDGYTIRGVQKVFRTQGIRYVAEVGKAGGIRLAPVVAVTLAAPPEPELALEVASVVPQMSEPADDIKPVRHKPYARTRPAPGPSPKPEAAQLSLVEPAPLKVSEGDRARFAERLAALAKLKTEIGAALSSRMERSATAQPRAPRAVRA